MALQEQVAYRVEGTEESVKVSVNTATGNEWNERTNGSAIFTVYIINAGGHANAIIAGTKGR